jgi:hypothetical protein
MNACPHQAPSPRRPRAVKRSPVAAGGARESRAAPLFRDLTRIRSLSRLSVLCAGLALAGCVATGDFGRPRPTLWNNLVAEPTGSIAARLRGEPVSAFVFTDDENELRDRAWRFLMPAHERAWFDKAIAELVRTRVLPATARPGDRTSYHRVLMRSGRRSPVSRYRRLAEDVAADAALIGPFLATAARVLASDEVRLRSLAYVQDLAESQIRDAAARVGENRCLVGWVRLAVVDRIASYRYAVEHLVIEAPDVAAIPAERALAGLRAHEAAFDGLGLASWHLPACGVVPIGVAALPLEALAPAAIVAKD